MLSKPPAARTVFGGMKVSAWGIIGIVAVCLLLILAGVGSFLLDFTCGKRKVDDAWDPEYLRKRGLGSVAEGILAGKAWFDTQEKEELEIRSEDGLRLCATFLPHPAARGTLLLFHGWRSSWKVDFGMALPFYHSLGLNPLLVDERAQGRSDGKYITYGVWERRDLALWVGCMAGKLGKDAPLILGGLSMGAATVLMASELDFDGDVRGIIADCGFTTPCAIIRHVAGKTKAIPLELSTMLLNIFTRLFAHFGLKDAGAPESLRKTKLPVLLIHGLADDFVPPEMSRENYAACASEKELVLVEGAGHGMSYPVDPERVRERIRAFVDRRLA